jgi:Zn finger protein HypA/HybF involved in hydrogenase expression
MDFGKINMHDFLLAKEIVDELNAIMAEKKITKIKSVELEIGMVSLAHDGFSEHTEDISVENLEFGLKSIIKNTVLKNVEFVIKKVIGNNWRITNIEVE